MSTGPRSLRRRGPPASSDPDTPTPASRFRDAARGAKHLTSDGRGAEASDDEEVEGDVVDLARHDAVTFSVLDVLRVLSGILLLSGALSWMVTGESVLWGWRPWWSRPPVLGAWLSGPVLLTDAELTQYDGSDPSKPIYVALNGTIYDVTGGRRIYGPGGSYNKFAGRDATRAFITGCFAEDLTPDVRGVELMFMPVHADEDADAATAATAGLDAAARKRWTAGIKVRRERERRLARKEVEETIEHWAALFRGERGQKPYFEVGRVTREDGWLEELPPRTLCEAARRARPTADAEPRT